MELHWIDVVDSTIKIGMGATVGAIGTWLSGRSRNLHELRRDIVARRHNLLERVAAEFESHAAIVGQMNAEISRLVTGHARRVAFNKVAELETQAFSLASLIGRKS